MMRRSKQALSAEECAQILQRNTSGVLALADRDQMPCAVPLSYVWDGQSLYFHCADQGEKLDIARENPKASFCVIDRDDVDPEKFTTRYLSVIAKGSIQILEDEAEICQALMWLGEKYSGRMGEKAIREHIESAWDHVKIIKLTPFEITGKMGSQVRRERMEQNEGMA